MVTSREIFFPGERCDVTTGRARSQQPRRLAKRDENRAKNPAKARLSFLPARFGVWARSGRLFLRRLVSAAFPGLRAWGRSVGAEGRSFRCCLVTAGRLVNPQECRRRRDRLSTYRSSTKPCGRSRSDTRTSPQLAPAPTVPCGE